MKPIEVIKIGKDYDAKNTDKGWNFLKKGHTVWIDRYSYHAYATIQHRLASAFFSAELAACAGYDRPFTIDIYVHPLTIYKYKNGDPETCLDRIKKWVLAMEPPRCPLLVRIYKFESNQQGPWPTFGYSDNFNCLWPLKRAEVPQGNYITYQPYENYQSRESTAPRSTRNEIGYEIQEVVLRHAEELGLEVVQTDYSMEFDEAVEKISGSLGHFSYFGSSYYIAAALGVRSHIFGYLYPPIKRIKHIHGDFWPSPWGGNKVTQIEIDSKNKIRKMFNAPVMNFSFIESPNELKDQLKNVADKKSRN